MINCFAIVATDFYGYISHQGKPVGMFSQCKSARSLDQAAMREAVKQVVLGSDNPMVVMGANSHEEIGGTMLEEVLREDFDHWCIIGSHEGVYCGHQSEHTELEDTMAEVRRKVFTAALKQGVDSILVLGGRSVYKAFEKHYSYIHHTVIKSEIGEGCGVDKRWDIPLTYTSELVLYDDECIRVQILAEKEGAL